MFKGGICSRVASSTQGWYMFKGGIQGTIYSRMVHMFKGGICSRVVYVQGWYMFKGSICSRVVSRVLSTQGWPLPVCVSQEV